MPVQREMSLDPAAGSYDTKLAVHKFLRGKSLRDPLAVFWHRCILHAVNIQSNLIIRGSDMQQSISLNGAWKLYYHPEIGEMPTNPEEVKTRGWPCIAASVPGNVELDLMRAGIEKDPFFGQNLYDYRKYESCQWWFEREFALPACSSDNKHAKLRFHGLDTFGTIWVNGQFAGRTDNMLIEHELDVTGLVKPGQTNQISIRIESSLNAVREKPYSAHIYGGEYSNEMPMLRKAPHAFGWDIAPRLLSAGLWRDVEVVLHARTQLVEAYYATRSISYGTAHLAVRYRFATDEPFFDDFKVRLTGRCGEHTFIKEAPARFTSDHMNIQVPNARLWWPRTYGDPDLYEVTLELLHNNVVVDQRTERIGIRTIKLDAVFEEGDAGRFQFTVNNVPIMVKGTNWVPLDALHSRDRDRLQQAHDLLVELECNMVRCWGGNVYEDHAFFDLCDERGIMVWQDFAMACAAYPQDDEFAHQIEREAVSIIIKLRNHASIVTWAGDNEVDHAYKSLGYQMAHSRLNRLTRAVLPRAVGCHDPYRNYLPSSPFIPDHAYDDLKLPEQHNWGPRDYYKGDFYKHTAAHFISEIGYHGCPALSSLQQFLSPGKLWPYTDNEEWDTHNTEYIRWGRRGYDRNELMANQVKILFEHIPDRIDQFALASQISQAEAKKFFIEMVRLRKWRRNGILWWNLLDCWPQISDSVVDYYYTKKLAYHYIKRSQNPICLIMGELERWHHPVVLANDGNRSGWVTYTVEDGDTSETLLEGSVYSPANENVRVGAIKSWEGRKKLYILKWTFENQEAAANHYISGHVPFDLAQYKRWLSIIEMLPGAFNSEACYSSSNLWGTDPILPGWG